MKKAMNLQKQAEKDSRKATAQERVRYNKKNNSQNNNNVVVNDALY